MGGASSSGAAHKNTNAKPGSPPASKRDQKLAQWNAVCREAARIVDEIQKPALIVDENGKINHVNEIWLQTCGFTEDEVLGSGFSIIQGPNTFLGE
jgi:PAS domain-containing protein